MAKLKILHYSDKRADDLIELYNQCDVLVCTGDLELFDFGELRNGITKPAFGVYGNHCSGMYFPQLGIENLHASTVNFSGAVWGGFQGCLRYKQGNTPMYTKEEAANFADTFPAVDVLLLHAGPLGMLDDPGDPVHIGSEDIRRYVLEKNPRFVFCGHQYSDAEMTIGPTKIFRTFGARLIEIEL